MDKPISQNPRVDPDVARSARRGDMPDGSIYDRPITPRISDANLGLSIAVAVIVGLFAIAMIFWLVR